MQQLRDLSTVTRLPEAGEFCESRRVRGSARRRSTRGRRSRVQYRQRGFSYCSIHRYVADLPIRALNRYSTRMEAVGRRLREACESPTASCRPTRARRSPLQRRRQPPHAEALVSSAGRGRCRRNTAQSRRPCGRNVAQDVAPALGEPNRTGQKGERRIPHRTPALPRSVEALRSVGRSAAAPVMTQ